MSTASEKRSALTDQWVQIPVESPNLEGPWAYSHGGANYVFWQAVVSTAVPKLSGIKTPMPPDCEL